jgi:hypothetical protein
LLLARFSVLFAVSVGVAGVLAAVLGSVNVAMSGWYCELAQPDSTANVPIKTTAAKRKRKPLGSLNVM